MNGVDQLVVLDQQHRGVPDHDPRRAPRLQLRSVHGRDPVGRPRVEDRLIRADASTQRQITAEIAAEAEHRPADAPEDHSSAARSAPAGGQRCRVQPQRQRVAVGVDQAGAADCVVDGLSVSPVVGTGQCRRTVGGDADGDQSLARRAQFLPTEQIEQRRAGEASDHDVGQHRMNRVAEPRAAQRVLELPAGQQVPHRPGRRLGDLIEKSGGLDRAHEWLERCQLPAHHT